MSTLSKQLRCVFCGQFFESNSQRAVTTELTAKQLEVITLVAAGLRTKQIAFELGIAAETVSFHLAAVRKKLGAKTNPHAVFLACVASQLD